MKSTFYDLAVAPLKSNLPVNRPIGEQLQDDNEMILAWKKRVIGGRIPRPVECRQQSKEEAIGVRVIARA
jgi:hypothetical protein